MKQIGNDGEVETMTQVIIAGLTTYQANIWQFVVPYFSRGWPPDLQFGQPGHTPQRGRQVQKGNV